VGSTPVSGASGSTGWSSGFRSAAFDCGVSTGRFNRWLSIEKFFFIVSRFTRNTPVITIKKAVQKITVMGTVRFFPGLSALLPLFFRSATIV
jgi:hypothetical protein